jgi:hypothetical protein
LLLLSNHFLAKSGVIVGAIFWRHFLRHILSFLAPFSGVIFGAIFWRHFWRHFLASFLAPYFVIFGVVSFFATVAAKTGES